MEKKLLVTISNDVDHLLGVKFICSFFNEMSEHQVTLLHIARHDSNDMTNTLMEKWIDPTDKGNFTVGAQRSINKAKYLLNENKMPIEQIVTKTVAERYGKVKDILAESSRGHYDTIVLGRRAGQWHYLQTPSG